MTNSVSLDSLREDIEKKYKPVVVDLRDGSEVVLRNLLRLPSSVRKEVTDLLKGMRSRDDEEVSSETVLANAQRVLEQVAADPKLGKKLVKELGDDLAVTSQLLRLWSEATQLGEAQPSQS